MRQRVKTIIKYVTSPSTYPFLLRMVKTKIVRGSMDLNATKRQATEWCRNLAVETKTAVRTLGYEYINPVEEFPDVYDGSRAAVRDCPQKMGGGGNTSLLYSLVHGLQAKEVIETGVAYGWSSLAILLGMRNTPSAKLYSSNLHYSTYNGDEKYVGCAVPERLRLKWTLIPKADVEAIPEILSQVGTIDLIHYDSSKSYEGRLATYPVLWEALRVGGLFVSDDIDDNVGFKNFCKMLHAKPIVVETPQESGPIKYVGVIQKVDNRKPRGLIF